MKNSNYKKILEEFEETLIKNNRPENSVKLMAVCKTRSLEEVQEVYNQGQFLFGENRVQEIQNKFSDRESWGENYEKISCHMIGHLQTNKVGKAVKLSDCIESVDSVKLLKQIENKAGEIEKPIEVLLEFNTSKEKNKSGFISENDLTEAFSLIENLKWVKVKGLMTVGPIGMGLDTKEWEKSTHESFILLRNLKEKYKDYFDGEVLSMGMSHDFKIAIEEGSTLVRVGTAIFGERK